MWRSGEGPDSLLSIATITFVIELRYDRYTNHLA